MPTRSLQSHLVFVAASFECRGYAKCVRNSISYQYFIYCQFFNRSLIHAHVLVTDSFTHLCTHSLTCVLIHLFSRSLPLTLLMSDMIKWQRVLCPLGWHDSGRRWPGKVTVCGVSPALWKEGDEEVDPDASWEDGRPTVSLGGPGHHRPRAMWWRYNKEHITHTKENTEQKSHR